MKLGFLLIITERGNYSHQNRMQQHHWRQKQNTCYQIMTRLITFFDNEESTSWEFVPNG